MSIRQNHTYLAFGPDGQWLGGTGAFPIVFGRPWPDGSYRLLRGALHFDDGLLTHLSVAGDSEWQRPDPEAAGECAVCLFSDLRPAGKAYFAAEAVKLHFEDGRLTGHETLGHVPVDRADVEDSAGD
jgi:hypothetical protein